MLDLDIQADVRGALDLFDDIGDRLSRPDEMLAVLVDSLGTYERDVFATEGHGTWPDLDPATVAAKGNSRILIYTGALLADLTGRGAVQIDGEDLNLAPTVPYGPHQKGRGRNPTPPPDERTVDGWAEQLLGHLVEGHR